MDHSMITVQVPDGAVAGAVLQVQAPNGQLVQAQIPPGVAPGGTFTIAVQQPTFAVATGPYVGRAGIPQTGRGDAAAATWIFCRDRRAPQVRARRPFTGAGLPAGRRRVRRLRGGRRERRERDPDVRGRDHDDAGRQERQMLQEPAHRPRNSYLRQHVHRRGRQDRQHEPRERAAPPRRIPVLHGPVLQRYHLRDRRQERAALPADLVHGPGVLSSLLRRLRHEGRREVHAQGDDDAVPVRVLRYHLDQERRGIARRQHDARLDAALRVRRRTESDRAPAVSLLFLPNAPARAGTDVADRPPRRTASRRSARTAARARAGADPPSASKPTR